VAELVTLAIEKVHFAWIDATASHASGGARILAKVATRARLTSQFVSYIQIESYSRLNKKKKKERENN
jgi:hypothetical protein